MIHMPPAQRLRGVSAGMGLARDRTMSYRRDRAETAEAFAGLAECVVSFAACRSDRVAFSAEQKRRAGDAHDPDLRGRNGRP
ncbi:MAG: hypothetical protein N2422_11300 [Rhodobacteraceae bacterium]|nr:hypothetical protein [Paracoccaceae bacterium]